jgi:uncharacterized membrane protein
MSLVLPAGSSHITATDCKLGGRASCVNSALMVAACIAALVAPFFGVLILNVATKPKSLLTRSTACELFIVLSDRERWSAGRKGTRCDRSLRRRYVVSV